MSQVQLVQQQLLQQQQAAWQRRDVQAQQQAAVTAAAAQNHTAAAALQDQQQHILLPQLQLLDDPSHNDLDPLHQRLQEASSCQGDLVSKWRVAARPRRFGAAQKQPDDVEADACWLVDEFFYVRGLINRDNQYRYNPGTLAHTDLFVKSSWRLYRYAAPQPVQSSESWVCAFHGTWWYAIWSVARSGVVLASDSYAKGHNFWEPGVYCSPLLETALGYARPQVLFADDTYHRVLLELRVDPRKRLRSRQRGGQQWVFPAEAVSIFAIWVQMNAPPQAGEERLRDWDPSLEAVPHGCSIPPAVINLPMFRGCR